MNDYSIKRKLVANFKGLSKNKYLIYFALMVISSITIWVLKNEISSVFFVAGLFLFAMIIDLIFDLLGYFKDTEGIKEISTIKKILGYIIGTIIFAILGIILLKIIESIWG